MNEKNYICAKCKVLACRKNDGTPMPKICPMQNQELLAKAMSEYQKPENHDFYIKASEIEGLGQFNWVRVKETVMLCHRMGFKRIGIAFCGGFHEEARVMTKILERNGFEVVSIMCKSGGNDKDCVGIRYKVHPGQPEKMCNPIFQAMTLNDAKTEFNIVMGLCVGHDSMFYKYSDALVTTLVTKDRVLGNNPVAALYMESGHYFINKLDIEEIEEK